MRGAVVRALAAVGLLLWAPPGVRAQMPPPTVLVEEVRLETHRSFEQVVGRVVALRQGGVAARVAAPVRATLVEVGDRVAAGDALVRLDDTRLRLDRELAAAGREAARAQLEEARRSVALLQQEIARLEKLRRSAAFPRARYEDRLAELEVARSRVAAAAARLAEAEVEIRYRAADLADATIRAPYAGVVTARAVSPGQYVGVGDTVVELVDDTALEIEADVPADSVPRLGRRARALVGDTGVSLHLRAVVPVENPLTRTRPVRFAFAAEPPGGLAAGQSVTLELAVGDEREVATVPKDAVTVSRNAYRVFVVEDDTAQPRTVELGEALGDRFVVRAGLEPGDLVVVRGNERLRPGQKVRIAGRDGERSGGTGAEPRG